MFLFLESADADEIREFCENRLIEGVVIPTAQLAKAKTKTIDLLKQIGEQIGGPVQVNAMADDYDTMMENADNLTSLAESICVSFPISYDGIRACRDLKTKHHKATMSFCFCVHQALLAAKASADFIAIDIGALNQDGQDCRQLIADIRKIYKNYDFKTKIMATSVNSLDDFKKVTLEGVDCISMPAQLMQQLVHDDLTDKSLKKAKTEWKQIGPLSD